MKDLLAYVYLIIDKGAAVLCQIIDLLQGKSSSA